MADTGQGREVLEKDGRSSEFPREDTDSGQHQREKIDKKK